MRFRCAFAALSLVGCVDLESSSPSLVCDECVPMCAAGVEPGELEGAAAKLGCDAELVVEVSPRPGRVVSERRPEVVVELARAPLSSLRSGQGCDGPIRLRRVGEVGLHPGLVQVDILSHASVSSLPLWPKRRDCVPVEWSIEGTTLRLSPTESLERLVWYEVQVVPDLELPGPGLCSQLAWRFTVDGCGDGVLDAAESFTDWVCMGRPEADRGWFSPYNEECDDGNDDNGDGCFLCVRESGFRCDEQGCHTRCGDAIRAGDEECDYGIHQPEGCEECRIAAGYECDFNGCRPVGPGDL